MAVAGRKAIECKSLRSPDETREFPQGKVEVVNLGGVTIGRATFQPGWKWSTSVKPIVGTNSCEAVHRGYVISGRMKVRMDDGTEQEFGSGDAMAIDPGHDAWVVGGEPLVALDFTGAAEYAKKPT